ncbi:hypothetical protein, partial [Escherichia coli]|uniref:hypothetical protein n=1 Tax=Escherichia coli TaxID=562 RepID=UPI001F4B7D39
MHQQCLLLPVIGYFGGEPYQGLLAEKWCLREQGFIFFPEPVQDTDTDFICNLIAIQGNDSNLLIVFYVQIMPDDFVMQLHR